MQGDRVQYTGPPLDDGAVGTGAVGRVIRVQAGAAFAVWPGRQIRSVPVGDLRLLGPEVTRVVSEGPNRRIWEWLGEELPPRKSGRPRDPYMDQGCHPDMVSRVWNELGESLPRDCRAQAKGKPVLAHPETDRIIALPHGTAYALWLAPDDFQAAREQGAQTVMAWSEGSQTDLAERAGPGWIWGHWYDEEPEWVQHAYAAAGPDQPTTPE
jgi:hypothetical protein